MKVYLKNSRHYLVRSSSDNWQLWYSEPRQQETRDFDYKIRELDEFECNFVESVFQHFAEPMKKLTGE